MKKNSIINKGNGGGWLNKPGDYIKALVTGSGRLVVKTKRGNKKHSIVKYPTTGTFVETIVHRF